MFKKIIIKNTILYLMTYMVISNITLIAQNPHLNAIRYVRVSPTGKYAASCSDNVLCIWSLTDKKLLHTFQEPTADILFPTDEILYKAEYENKKCIVSQYNLISGKKEKIVFEKEDLKNITFSPKGTYLAGVLNGSLYVVNLNTGQPIEKFINHYSMASSTDLFFSYDEKYLYQVSNLNVFNRFITETAQKDWQMNKPLNDKLMIRSICNIKEKCFVTGKFSISDKNLKNFYVFSESKNELSSWTDVDFQPFKAIFNPASSDEVILASYYSNQIAVVSSEQNTVFKHTKTKINTKDFLRDIDISKDGNILVVASSSGYGITKPGQKGYAKIEVYDWKNKKKIMEF